MEREVIEAGISQKPLKLTKSLSERHPTLIYFFTTREKFSKGNEFVMGRFIESNFPLQ